MYKYYLDIIKTVRDKAMLLLLFNIFNSSYYSFYSNNQEPFYFFVSSVDLCNLSNEQRKAIHREKGYVWG